MRIPLIVMLMILLAGCATKGAAPVDSRSGSAAYAKPIRTADSYQVRRGDTLYAIAWRYKMDYHLLAAWNGIRGPDYLIYPGQILRMRPPPLSRRPGARRAPVKPLASHPEVSKPPVPPRVVPVKPEPRAVETKPIPPKTAKTTTGPVSLKLDWRWPTKGRIVQTYSADDPARKGIWISGVEGQPVVAAESGRVVYSGSGLVGYGNLVIIKHNHEYLSAYGYNKKLLVKEGDRVARGEQIAYMGSPRNGADSILHFEIRKEGRPINPLPLLPRL